MVKTYADLITDKNFKIPGLKSKKKKKRRSKK